MKLSASLRIQIPLSPIYVLVCCCQVILEMGDHKGEFMPFVRHVLASIFFFKLKLARRKGIKFYLTSGKTRFFRKREGLISNKFSSKLDSHVMGIFSPSSLI